MARDILIINGHPDPSEERFCHALARSYASGATAGGYDIQHLRVAALDFPWLAGADDFENRTPPQAIQAAQDQIRRANHLVIVYPLWLGSMPAILKAFFEQTFRPDFAFERTTKDWPKPGLAGRSARVVVTMGMPAPAYRWYYLAHSLKSLERNILKFSGIKPVRETLIGGIGEIDQTQRQRWLTRLETLGQRGL
ncbi:MAG: NAD(P)H-dependent oxidoreductase [Geminicoccaceae bacterium]